MSYKESEVKIVNHLTKIYDGVEIIFIPDKDIDINNIQEVITSITLDVVYLKKNINLDNKIIKEGNKIKVVFEKFPLEKENESDSSESGKSEEEAEKKDQIKSAPKRTIKHKYSIAINQRQALFGIRGSIAATLYRPEHRKLKSAPNIEIQKVRPAPKKPTGFHKEAAITKETISYPLENLRPFPILEKNHKELIYLYITEGEIEFLLMHRTIKKNVYVIPEEDILENFKYHQKFYYKSIFKKKGNLEERLLISMSEKMKSIKHNYFSNELKNIEIRLSTPHRRGICFIVI